MIYMQRNKASEHSDEDDDGERESERMTLRDGFPARDPRRRQKSGLSSKPAAESWTTTRYLSDIYICDGCGVRGGGGGR